MNDQNDKRGDVDRSSNEAAAKAVWHAPTLTILGRAAALTHSGGAGKNDGLASS